MQIGVKISTIGFYIDSSTNTNTNIYSAYNISSNVV